MSKYGQVINGSIKRGVIKGTNIENGTRYVQILNCSPIIPVRTNFGRFEIRLYADNNRTECSYCQQTNHPYYRCPTKPTSIKTCYNCIKRIWPKEKVQKDKQQSTKHTYKSKDQVTRTPLKTGSELRCKTSRHNYN